MAAAVGTAPDTGFPVSQSAADSMAAASPVIDGAQLLGGGKREVMIRQLENLESDYGWRMRVLTRYAPEQFETEALRAVWQLDDRTVVVVADVTSPNILNSPFIPSYLAMCTSCLSVCLSVTLASQPDDRTVVVVADVTSPNILNFFAGDTVREKLPRQFFIELQSRYTSLVAHPCHRSLYFLPPAHHPIPPPSAIPFLRLLRPFLISNQFYVAEQGDTRAVQEAIAIMHARLFIFLCLIFPLFFLPIHPCRELWHQFYVAEQGDTRAVQEAVATLQTCLFILLCLILPLFPLPLLPRTPSFGNQFYVAEQGDTRAVQEAVATLQTCLLKPTGCNNVPGLVDDLYFVTLSTAILSGIVFGFAARLEPSGKVEASWQWVLLFSPLWLLLLVAFSYLPITARTDNVEPLLKNGAGFLAGAAAIYLTPIFGQSPVANWGKGKEDGTRSGTQSGRDSDYDDF
ncbi:unnamed protein product [Closterium sp. Naga37s-1]|nr:unnamed protein product [Closterium sp. Naga37s-1]